MRKYIFIILFILINTSCITINFKYPQHSINHTKEKGRYGLWIEKDSISKNIIIADYKNNIKDGYYIEYIDLTNFNEKMLKNMFGYKDELINFTIIDIACQTGYVICVGKYKNNKRIGKWKFFLNDGYCFKLIKYKDGNAKYMILYDFV